MESEPKPPQELPAAPVLGSLALGGYKFIVTEIPRALEPLDKDTFIEGL